MKKFISMVMSLVLMLSLVPSALAAGSPRVVLSSQNLTVNGEVITGLEIYNIDGNNYFKLRDVAYLLNGTESQFNVTWDAEHNAVLIDLGVPYVAVGGECVNSGVDKSSTAVKSSQTIWIDTPVSIAAYNIGGNNYLKLRDLLSYTTATVDWDASTNTIVVATPTSTQPSSDVMTDAEYIESVKQTSPEGYAGAMALHDELWATGQLTSSMNERQIFQVYYTWIQKNVKYDQDVNSISHSPTGFFKNHKAVCDGYSKSFKLLMNIEGIRCGCCATQNGYNDHMWNKVTLDGREIYIDVTNPCAVFTDCCLVTDTEWWVADADLWDIVNACDECEAWLGFRL